MKVLVNLLGAGAVASLLAYSGLWAWQEGQVAVALFLLPLIAAVMFLAIVDWSRR